MNFAGGLRGSVPCVQGLEAFVARLLFQTADCGVAGGWQGHGTQHQAGYGLHRQHIQLGALQVLLAKGTTSNHNSQRITEETKNKKKKKT